MVSLGKVAAPKPLNLPSQKKENNGNDPSVNLISKTGGWGSTSGGGAPTDDPAAKQPERAIPAQPAPAWGGAGLPEERKKQVELAAQQEFPVLGDERGPPGRHGPHDRYGYHEDDPRRRPWDADERGPYAGPPDDGPYRGRYYERGPYHPMDRPSYDRYERYGRFDGPPGVPHASLACCISANMVAACSWAGALAHACGCWSRPANLMPLLLMCISACRPI
jgi:collagen type III alpha